ncbi:MAG: hypothetical protein IJE40_03735 [Clostridia bacterium]|nr:hypothetical protein [Clostridia bacterium]
MNGEFELKIGSADHLEAALQNPTQKTMNVASGVESMRQHYIDRAQRRIEMYRDTEQQYLDDMLKEIDERTEDQITRLKAAFNENSDKWIDDIFNSIVFGN